MSTPPDKETPTPRTVKRYDPFEKCAMGGTTTGQMREDEHGDWVLFDDYAAITPAPPSLLNATGGSATTAATSPIPPNRHG